MTTALDRLIEAHGKTTQDKRWAYWPDHYTVRTDETFLNFRKDICKTSCGNGAEHANGTFIALAHNELPQVASDFAAMKVALIHAKALLAEVSSETTEEAYGVITDALTRLSEGSGQMKGDDRG